MHLTTLGTSTPLPHAFWENPPHTGPLLQLETGLEVRYRQVDSMRADVRLRVKVGKSWVSSGRSYMVSTTGPVRGRPILEQPARQNALRARSWTILRAFMAPNSTAESMFVDREVNRCTPATASAALCAAKWSPLESNMGGCADEVIVLPTRVPLGAFHLTHARTQRTHATPNVARLSAEHGSACRRLMACRLLC